MDYYISIDDVYDKLLFYKERLERIDFLINQINDLLSKIEWTGEAYESFLSNYLMYIERLQDMKNGQLYYVKMLYTFYSKYNNLYDEMEKEFIKSLNEMEGNIDARNYV